MENIKFEIPDYVEEIIQKLEIAGFEAYAVGGCVRDMLMGRVPDDFDVCTNALPDKMLHIFKDYKVIETGIKHGTVTVVNNHNHVEVTTYRIDGEYLDNRRPENVEFTSDLREDLVRRDFTVNAMVYSPTKGVIDFFGGMDDIKNKVIRCVGSPDERFNEDALRIMRAIRFSSVLGFTIDKETSQSIFKNTHLLANISAERKAVELNKLLLGKDVCRILYDYARVLCFIIPPLESCIDKDQKNPHHIYDIYTHTVEALRVSKKDLIVRLSVLLHDTGKPLCMTVDENGCGHFYGHAKISTDLAKKILSDLKYDNNTINTVTTLVKYHDIPLSDTVKGAKRLLCKLTEPVVRLLLDVKYADICALAKQYVSGHLKTIKNFEKLLNEIIEQNQCFCLKDLKISGKDIISLGVQPGPKIGVILKKLLDEVIEDTTENSLPALLERAAKIINSEEL